MEGTWHSIEWIFNTLLFQLAGMIIGSKFIHAHLTFSDFSWAFVTYAFLIVIRFITILVLFPLLRNTGYGMDWPSAVVSAWGGLRGALGLALALMMEHELTAAGEEKTGHLIVIHVSVVGLLTLLINAPTTAPLLRVVGLLQTPREKELALKDLRGRLQDHALDQYRRMAKASDLAIAREKTGNGASQREESDRRKTKLDRGRLHAG